jgi:hypothetical protein
MESGRHKVLPVHDLLGNLTNIPSGSHEVRLGKMFPRGGVYTTDAALILEGIVPALYVCKARKAWNVFRRKKLEFRRVIDLQLIRGWRWCVLRFRPGKNTNRRQELELGRAGHVIARMKPQRGHVLAVKLYRDSKGGVAGDGIFQFAAKSGGAAAVFVSTILISSEKNETVLNQKEILNLEPQGMDIQDIFHNAMSNYGSPLEA